MAIDSSLLPLLEADGDRERERRLGTIFTERVDPIVDEVLRTFRSGRFALTAEDAEDLKSTVHLRLLQRLRSMVDGGEAIARLEDYVATLTYRAVYDLQRRRFPERTRLKNRTRYLLTHDARFELWTTRQGSMCALREAGRRTAPRAMAVSGRHLDMRQSGDAIEDVLRNAGGAVALDDLVDVLAAAWRVTDTPRPLETAPELAVTNEMDAKDQIAALWREVLLLRPNQRAALLLNLRDSRGGNALALIHLLGLATFDQIAAAVDIAPPDLAAIWPSLPLDDQTIAARLGLTRQQIINLRKAARTRLARRLNKPRP